MSLAPKIDEIREVINHAYLDFVCITETWLREHIADNIIAISGFNVIRRDRVAGLHGGVCMYVKDSIKFKVLDEYMHPNFEVLWTQISPQRLPRGISSIVIGTVYHPPRPSSMDSLMLDYL